MALAAGQYLAPSLASGKDYSWVAAPNAGDVMTNVMVVERFFRDLTEDVVREGSFTSVEELVTAMMAYLGERNLHPKPYVWKKKGEEILAKIQRAREALTKNQ